MIRDKYAIHRPDHPAKIQREGNPFADQRRGGPIHEKEQPVFIHCRAADRRAGDQRSHERTERDCTRIRGGNSEP